jgi:spermidine/putrescine transport system permease protein
MKRTNTDISKRVKRIDIAKYVSIVPLSFWMIAFIALPLLYIIFMSFLQRGEDGGLVYSFTLSNYTRMGNPLYIKIFYDSLKIAFITTLLTLIFGYPFAYFATKISKRFRILVLMIIIIPFWTNSLIRAYGWMVLLRTEGLFNNILISLHLIKEPLKMLYTYGAVLIGMVYTLFPFMVLPLYNSIEKLDKSYLEAAKDLGASRWKAFLTITIPLTMPGIISGTILVFIPSIGLFYIPDLMGGSKVILIGNLIKNQFLQSRDWPFGAALSIMMIFISLILIGVYIKIANNKVDLEVF